MLTTNERVFWVPGNTKSVLIGEDGDIEVKLPSTGVALLSFGAWSYKPSKDEVVEDSIKHRPRWPVKQIKITITEE